MWHNIFHRPGIYLVNVFGFHYLINRAIFNLCTTFSTSQEPYDTDEMAKEFVLSFPNQVFTVGQQLAFSFKDKKLLLVVVKELQGT